MRTPGLAAIVAAGTLTGTAQAATEPGIHYANAIAGKIQHARRTAPAPAPGA